jgi:hypothetical protein
VDCRTAASLCEKNSAEGKLGKQEQMKQKIFSCFETRSLPALTRSYPRRFTFYVAHPIRSIPGFLIRNPHPCYPCNPWFRFTFALIPTNPGPVILAANTKYVLGASFLTNDGDSFKFGLGGNQPTYDPAVSPGNSRSSGFGFPQLNSSPGAFVGPNATFRSVPEGGSTLLLMAMAIAIGWGVIALAIRQPRTLSGLKPSNR